MNYKGEAKKLLFELDTRYLKGRSVMAIDMNRLEQEWAEQAERHRILCQIKALYQKMNDEASAALEVAEALSAKAIRKKPDKYGTDGKLTEPMVKASIVLHPLYKEANDQVIEAKYSMRLAEGNVSASDHRKKALEKVVDLWSQAYFGSPKTSDVRAREKLNKAAERKAFRKKNSKRG